VRKILNELSDFYANTEDNLQRITAYGQMKNHPGWAVHQEILMLCRGKIAEEVLSKRFTDLGSTEKDVRQRAYAIVDEFIKFLLNPLAKAQKRANFERGFEEAIRRKQPQRRV